MRVAEEGARTHLRIDDKHDGAAAAKDHVRVKRRVEKIDLSRKVPHLKLHKRAIAYICIHARTHRQSDGHTHTDTHTER
jgi:hypothetical protein